MEKQNPSMNSVNNELPRPSLAAFSSPGFRSRSNSGSHSRASSAFSTNHSNTVNLNNNPNITQNQNYLLASLTVVAAAAALSNADATSKISVFPDTPAKSPSSAFLLSSQEYTPHSSMTGNNSVVFSTPIRPPLLNASSVFNTVPSSPVFRIVNKNPPATPSRNSQSQKTQSAIAKNKPFLSASAANLFFAADNVASFSTPHGPSPESDFSSIPRRQTHELHQQHKQQLSLLFSPTVRAASMPKFSDDENDSDGEEGGVDITSPTRNLRMTVARSLSRRATSKSRKALHPVRHTPLPLSLQFGGVSSSSSALSLSTNPRKNNRDLFSLKRDLSKGSLLTMNLSKSPLLSLKTHSGGAGNCATMQFGNNDLGGDDSDDDEEMPDYNRFDNSSWENNGDNALFRVLNDHKAKQKILVDSMDQDENEEKEDQNRATPTPELLGAEDTTNPIFQTPHHHHNNNRQQQELNHVTPDNQTTPVSQQVGNPLFTLLNPGLVPPVGQAATAGGGEGSVAMYAHMLNPESMQRLFENKCQHQLPSRDANGKLQLPHDHLTAHYKVIQRLGRGSFADVFKVQLVHQRRRAGSSSLQSSTNIPAVTINVSTGSLRVNSPTDNNNAEYYAVKKTRVAITGAKDRRARLEELVIMYRLLETGDVSHVVAIREAWEQYGCLYFVMEFCAKGTLLEYMDSKNGLKDGGGIEEFAVWGILGQVAMGLNQIHKLDIIHLDLKPGNILISEQGKLKIGDFGCAAFLPVAQEFEREGDRTYIAPEIMIYQYGKECDIFSLGLIIFEIATNIILPENGNHWQKLRRHDFSEVLEFNRVSPILVDLIKAMLHPEKNKRIPLDTILGHAFVTPFLDGESLF
ncbi:hypothetical protein HK100_011205 [Physocladia obscura]|uniref:Protein kinase domain-containing protein n=1 Tax=Physocladia obscura TaxID=109957 RepID=A0AAD5XEA9_9FUNG|nr:hypothetical protein HK100_011205 [Physocladia obscura]